MHLNFKEDDIITVYRKNGLSLNSFKFRVIRISKSMSCHKIFGSRFTVDNKEIEGYIITLHDNGETEIEAPYSISRDKCYLDKQLAISQMEKLIEKEFRRIKERKSELLKLKFIKE